MKPSHRPARHRRGRRQAERSRASTQGRGQRGGPADAAVVRVPRSHRGLLHRAGLRVPDVQERGEHPGQRQRDRHRLARTGVGADLRRVRPVRRRHRAARRSDLRDPGERRPVRPGGPRPRHRAGGGLGHRQRAAHRQGPDQPAHRHTGHPLGVRRPRPDPLRRRTDPLHRRLRRSAHQTLPRQHQQPRLGLPGARRPGVAGVALHLLRPPALRRRGQQAGGAPGRDQGRPRHHQRLRALGSPTRPSPGRCWPASC